MSTMLELIQKKQSERLSVKQVSDVNFDGWMACPKCQKFVEKDAIKANLQVCTACTHHLRMIAEERIQLLVDADSFEEWDANLVSKDPLQFEDTKVYKERLKEAQKQTGMKDAVITGIGKMDGRMVAIGAMDFRFIGGSLGTVVGERLTRLVERALLMRVPLVIVSQTGGARMQESIFSLMQMVKVSQALWHFHEAGLFYISVLSDPTMGGVTASYASLGDVILAEPRALIGFAGARVIEQTIKKKLPEGAQTAEFQLQHGMVDQIVPRGKLKETICTLINHFVGVL